jgi:hypothetical protein
MERSHYFRSRIFSTRPPKRCPPEAQKTQKGFFIFAPFEPFVAAVWFEMP